MKKIFKYILPCLSLMLAFTSCYDTMDDKASIDAAYEKQFKNATVSIASVTAPAYNTVEVTCTVGDVKDVAEQGIQFSKTEDMTGAKFLPNDTIEAEYTLTVDGLEEATTYYVRAYAMSKTGVPVYSKVQAITTPEAPGSTVDGTYIATEYTYDNGNWIQGKPYEITIEFAEGSETTVLITNIWGGGMTVEGIYDPENNTITVPNYSVIFNYPGFGDFWLESYDDEDEDAIIFHFNPRGGSMESTVMGVIFEQGAYEFLYLVMQHE